ncbi:hypothetical protein DSLASN_05020 [Desulfoluna limicola]|uniref:Uncharacterized protein n=1 Tax=Desulfoluna limicola TaxID=2810562 RepID=A0ABM7PCE1_9BACT|nr:hypothetical protein DSLASN_05020 [Desulfoluna limicola]
MKGLGSGVGHGKSDATVHPLCEQVKVLFTKGVVHLCHYAYRAAIVGEAIVKADRIKHTAEVAGRSDDHDLLGFSLTSRSLVLQITEQSLPKALSPPVQIVILENGNRAKAIVPEKRQAAVQVGEFIEVNAVKRDRVTEPMPHRPHANMLHDPFDDG